jgi:hypothetical protein
LSLSLLTPLHPPPPSTVRSALYVLLELTAAI